MDYELRIVVEKVAISSQEVIQWDTITSYALQCPTSIGELGLRHTEQIALLEKVQNILLAEQSLLLDPGIHICPACGNTLKETLWDIQVCDIAALCTYVHHSILKRQ
jgi:hypothetical protein